MDFGTTRLDGESLMTPEGILSVTAPGTVVSDADAAEALLSMLDAAELRFGAGERPGKVSVDLFTDLRQLRDSVGDEAWQPLVAMAQAHPVAAIVHEDPFVRRSFDRPRGYCGDAHLLDFIYRHPDISNELSAATERGRALYEVSVNAPAAAAVRERRLILAAFADIAAERVGQGAEILAIASGHLREAELSLALRDGLIGRWVALDQDPLSVAKARAAHAGTAVEALDGSVKGLLAGEVGGTYDAIYAAGLYDYLPRPVAIRLTRKCLEMLKPGGTLLFANFATQIPDGAFMETMMNWPLILRTEAEVREIADAAARQGMERVEVWAGENGNVIYSTIERFP